MMSLSKCEVKERSGLVRVHGLFLFPQIGSHRMRTKSRAHTAIIDSCVILVNLGRPIHCRPTAHQPKVTLRSHHSHDSTTVLSSIPWNLLPCTHLLSLLAPPYYYHNTKHHHHPNSTSFIKAQSTIPTTIHTCSFKSQLYHWHTYQP